MKLPTRISCFSLSYQKLNDKSLGSLSDAFLENDEDTIKSFKNELGLPIDQISFIIKCNAVIIILAYSESISEELIKGRLIGTWDKFSRGGVMNSMKDIKLFHDIEAFKYIAECSVGLHSVTIGDSQVLSQVCDSIKKSAHFQKGSRTFPMIRLWLKSVAEEIELRTDIFSGNTSLERIACELVGEKLEKNKTISIVGFGKTGKLVYKILSKELGYTVKVANRNPKALEDIKQETEVLELTSHEDILNCNCLVLSIDNNEETQKYISKLISNLSDLKKLIIVDFASPSFSLPNNKLVEIIDLEVLSNFANKNIEKRSKEVVKVKQIIDKACPKFAEDLNRVVANNILESQKRNFSFILNEEKLNIIKIRSDVYKSIRRLLDDKKFIEVTTPHVVAISTDPPRVDKGTTLGVDWGSGVKAFLRQSNQIYKQIIAVSGIPKIYEIGPFWRAEASQSYRHLQESIGLDIEIQKPESIENLYQIAYEVIYETNKTITSIYKIENKLSLPKFKDVPILNYQEAIDLLSKNGYVINLGDDLGVLGEAKLGQIIKKENKSDVFIVKDYPDTIKKFYTKSKESGLTYTFDIIVAGWELVSGAIRETDREKIEKTMLLSGVDKNDYGFYLSIIENAVEHGGFCLGLDRLISKIVDCEIITDSVAFPRTSDRLIP